jgi:hypothetical protein
VYEANISRKSPGCIMFLLDRSGSMTEPFGAANGMTLADGATRAINKVLFDLCLRAQKEPGAPPRAYFDIGVFGYGQSATSNIEAVEPALQGNLAGQPIVSITDLAMNPLAIRDVQQNLDLPPSKMPVWFDPVAGHATPMCQAIATAGAHVATWVQAHPDSYPPIVINITDGVVTDEGYQGAGLAEWASRLTSLATYDGNALLFNVFLSSVDAPISYFPATGQHLPDPGPSLFDIASELPAPMARQAESSGLPIAPGARGLVFNADVAALAKFLEIGTRPGSTATADR